MLLTRKEMTFDFAGAKFELPRDREVLGWIFSQFLYGEVTGIQVGHWIQEAPTLDAADFLAKQCIQELVHIKTFRRCFEILGVAPQPPHRVVRLLSTDFIGGTFEEHVALEMAQGEGFVLQAFYAVIDTLDHPQSVDILQRAVRQEEGHVEFGERETMRVIANDPAARRKLLGLSLVWMWGVQQLARFMQKRLPPHPVLERMPEFLGMCLRCNELRLQRMGVLQGALSELSIASKTALVAEAYARKTGGSARARLAALRPGGKRRLTETYLDDPAIREAMRAAAE